MKKIILLVTNVTIFFMLVGGVEAGWKDTWDSFGKSVNESIKDLNQAIGGVTQTKKKIKDLKGPENPDNTPPPIPNQNQFPSGNQNQSGQSIPTVPGQAQPSQPNQNQFPSGNQNQSGWQVYPDGAPPARGTMGQTTPTTGQSASPFTGNMTALAQKYGLRTFQGRIMISGRHSTSDKIMTKQDIVALNRFFDLTRLGLNPEVGKYVPPSSSQNQKASAASSRRAECYANFYLPEGQKNQVFAPYKISGVVPRIGWKGRGNNELEVDRMANKFTTEFLPQIVANAPRLPLEFVYVQRSWLDPYDRPRGGFPVKGIPKSGSRSGSGDLTLPMTRCIHPNAISDYQYSLNSSSYLPFAAKLPTFWKLDPQTAEQKIINRIPTSKGGIKIRRIYSATTFTLSADSSLKAKYKNKDIVSLTPLMVTVKSFSLYEDPKLQRLLHTFELEAPAASPVLLTGIPEKAPTPKRVFLNKETVTLLLLKEHGDILNEKAWGRLVAIHSRNDQDYYNRSKRQRTGNSIRTVKWNAFDPDYVPFFPKGFSMRKGANEHLQKFKQWSLKRAAALPNKFVLQTQLKRDRNGTTALDLGVFKASDRSELLAALKKSGYVPRQIVSPDFDRLEFHSKFDRHQLAGQGKSRMPIMVLANLLKTYTPQFSEAQDQQFFSTHGGRIDTELDVVVQRTEQLGIGGAKEAFVLYTQPVAIRILNKDASAVLYEQAYQVAKLDPNQSSAGSVEVARPTTEKMPFSAEVADLLMAKFVPEALDQAALERMILARWNYENSFNRKSKKTGPEEPEWGRFFVEGKLKPNAQQRAELAPSFKDWTLKRAKAIPTVVTVVFPANTKKPGPMHLGQGQFGYAMEREPKECLKRAKRLRSKQPVLAETYDRACAFLENASTTLGREIYLKSYGKKTLIKSLSPESRSSSLQKNRGLDGVGPRMNCGKAIYGRQDKYCSGMWAELNGELKNELLGQKMALDDVLVIDKEVVIPDQLDITSLKKLGNVVELDVEIVGIRRSKQIPPHPFLAAYRQYEDYIQKAGIPSEATRWTGQFDQETVPLFLFDAQVREARIVKKGNKKKKIPQQILAKLPLQEPRSPDASLLTTAAAAKRVLSSSERRKLERDCQKKYRTDWAPPKGTPEFGAAVATCIEAPPIEAYGPDMVGLRLGMNGKEADSIVSLKFKNKKWSSLTTPRPFEKGKLHLTDDVNRGIALFFIKNHGRDLVAGVSRRVYFGDNGPETSKIANGLRKKYGAEAWKDGDRAMVWTFPTGSENSSTNDYAGLVEQVTSRSDLGVRWVPRMTAESRQQAMQKRQEKSGKHMACVQSIMGKLGVANDDTDGDEYMKKFQKEKSLCDQNFGPQSRTKKTEEPKLPIMIKAEGNPGFYAKYESSGPVIIVLFNKDTEGKVKDASFVLFDPAWIARQPAFAFKKGGGAGGVKQAQGEIDF